MLIQIPIDSAATIPPVVARVIKESEQTNGTSREISTTSKHISKKKKPRAGFFQQAKSRAITLWKHLQIKKGGLKVGQVILLSLVSIALLAVIGIGLIILAQGIGLGGGSETLGWIIVILGLAVTLSFITWMWIASIRKSDPTGWQQKKEVRKARKNNEQLYLEKQRLEEEAIIARLPKNPVVEISSSDIRICLTEANLSDGDIVNIFFNDKLLIQGAKLGKVPHCFNLTLQKNATNILSVETISGGQNPIDRVKVSIEEENSKKLIYLPTLEGQAASLSFNLK
jgi:hypothetical protein